MIKKNRALSLLLAAGLTTGIVTVPAPIAPAQETQTQTMAEIYQPYFDDLSFKEAHRQSEWNFLKFDGPTPLNVTYKLMNANVSDDLRSDGGLLYSLRTRLGTSRLSVQMSPSADFYNPEGNTSTAEVLVQYHDGSNEIVTANLEIIPTNARTHTPTYSGTDVRAGETTVVSPTSPWSVLPGTTFSIVETQDLEFYRQAGWSFELDRASGDLSITVPKDAGRENYPSMLLSVQFPDRSSELVTISPNILPDSADEGNEEVEGHDWLGPEPPRNNGGSSFFGSSF